MKPQDDDLLAADAASPPNAPCAAALLAGTLALMTSWADPCCGHQGPCPLAMQRRLMARKIVSNLVVLKEHAQVPPLLRQVMGNAHRRWLLVAASFDDDAVDATQGDALPRSRVVH